MRSDPDQYVAELANALLEIEERLIPTGLHVLDQPGDLADAVAMAAEHHAPETIARLQADLERPTEVGAILRALSGRYTPPSSGGDLIRNPRSIPTGRNLHGLNPALVPSAYASSRPAAPSICCSSERWPTPAPIPKASAWCCGAPTTSRRTARPSARRWRCSA